MDILRLNRRYFPANEKDQKRFMRSGLIPGQQEEPERKHTLVDTAAWLNSFFEPLNAVPFTRYKVEGGEVRVVSKSPELHLNTLIQLRSLSNKLCKYGGMLDISHKDDRRTKAILRPYRGDVLPYWEEGVLTKSIRCNNGTTLRLHKDAGVPTISIQGSNVLLSAAINADVLEQINSFFEGTL